LTEDADWRLNRMGNACEVLREPCLCCRVVDYPLLNVIYSSQRPPQKSSKSLELRQLKAVIFPGGRNQRARSVRETSAMAAPDCLLGAHMGASDRNVKVRASNRGHGDHWSRQSKTEVNPTTKAAGRNVFDMRRQCQLQAHLGRNLQAVYQDVVKEPVPERLIELIGGLKRQENEK
jgi:hypothetical protein